MSQLKRGRHHQAEDHRPADIDGNDDPPWEIDERNDDGPTEEHRLPGDERGEVPPTRETQRALRKSSANQGNEITGCLPADTHQRVQRPDVEVLESVPPPVPLRGGKPRKRDLI